MPSIVLNTAVGAGATVNVVAGTQYEFMPFHGHVEFGICSDVTGVVATIYGGTDLLMQESPVDIKAVNQLPIYPDNFHVNDDLAAGDRLNVTIRNTTGATRQVVSVIRLNPL
jgi:hypothetical protein